MAKCTRCRKSEPVIDLSYTKKSLCPDCFIYFFERRVRKTIRRYGLLDSCENMAVALSGNEGSMVVLSILKSLSKKSPKSKLFAIIVDEGLPGHRDKLMAIGPSYCKKLGVDCHVYSFKEELGMTMAEMAKKAEKLGIDALPCDYCRVFRRQLLNQAARELGATKLVFGTNLDDECEAALTGLVTGDLYTVARDGAAIQTGNGNFPSIITPLRECPENEVTLYAKLKKMPMAAGKCMYSQDPFKDSVGRMKAGLSKKYPAISYQVLASVDELVPILKGRNGKDAPKVCKRCGEIVSGKECNFCQVRKALGLGS